MADRDAAGNGLAFIIGKDARGYGVRMSNRGRPAVPDLERVALLVPHCLTRVERPPASPMHVHGTGFTLYLERVDAADGLRPRNASESDDLGHEGACEPVALCPTGQTPGIPHPEDQCCGAQLEERRGVPNVGLRERLALRR